MKLFDGIRRLFTMKQSSLTFSQATALNGSISEKLDFNANAFKNRVWYRGDSGELEQLYTKYGISKYGFWGQQASTPSQSILKFHTGLPSCIVDTLTNISVSDFLGLTFEDEEDKKLWEEITKDNKLKKLIEKSVKETLYIGDGSYKITFDTSVSQYPIIEFYPGDMVEFITARGRLKEVVFKTPYKSKGKNYVLHEYYGYGYIKNKLFYNDEEVDIDSVPETAGIRDIWFAGYKEDADGNVLSKGEYILAIPSLFFDSPKYEGRGQSIFDKKTDNFMALDEVWSQWLDALRSGRSKTYIPDSLLPKDPTTGKTLTPNYYDNRYIVTESDMREGGKNEISLQQSAIPHESYDSTYITALNQCLIGLISPSTIGIDVKKMDNAEAQREKEKTTLYTRQSIVDALGSNLVSLAKACITAYKEIYMLGGEASECNADFGEYANPSFEAQIETYAKAKQSGIMSYEAIVDGLYGDTKDKDWKEEEVAKLKEQNGIAVLDTPQFF